MKKLLKILKVKKSADYRDRLVKALDEAGFTVIQEQDGLIEYICIIAESEEKHW